MSELTERQEQLLSHLPALKSELADELDVVESTLDGYRSRLRERDVNIRHEKTADGYRWYVDADDLPSTDDLTDRELYVLRELQQGRTLHELADDLEERPSVVEQHVDNLRTRGWDIYHDEDAGLYELENGGELRSSEHKGTRTRKANQWWEIRNNVLEREWKRIEPVDPDLASTPDGEDWVTHLTDLHAGDRVRDYSGEEIYSTADICNVVEYITRQSLSLAEHHGASYDTAHLLWGGDMVTNEGIYEGQFEDLDAWLDEQVSTITDALIEQVLSFAESFDVVQVVCQVGNHGDMRASATSRKANADLLVYKAVQNFVGKSQQEWSRLENVTFKLANARAYTPVELRGGKLHGHLRHGQHRKPQAETSARQQEWLSTLLDTVQSSWGSFDVSWIGHHHVSGRVPWNGPPIFVSGSPKPGGEYVDELGTNGEHGFASSDMAHCHGVSDEGVTGIYPIDDRYYDGYS